MPTRKDQLAAIWSLCDLSVNSLVDRIILQKTVYLLASLGLKEFGSYKSNYSMYVYGPYSRMVAKDAYEVAEAIKEKKVEINPNLKSAAIPYVEKLNAIVRAIPKTPDETKDVNHELLANILYIRQDKPSITDADLFKMLVQKHSYLDHWQKFIAAQSALRAHGLIS